MTSPASSKQAVARTRDMPDVTLDPAKLDHEIALLVEQWLSTRSYPRTAEALNEEVLSTTSAAQADVVREVERGLLDGEYGILEGLVGASGLRLQTQRAFLYMCYRQQFLEHVENRESQKAFNLLSKRLKPLEHYQPYPYDFYNLAYLTSASTVHDAPAFRDWKGVQREREGLVGMWRELMQAPAAAGAQAYVPPNRLEVLLRQAAQWQVQQASSSAPAGPVALPSLLRDYQPLVLPNAMRMLVRGHQANVKCVDVVSAHLGVSGSSDSTLRIFALDDGHLVHRLTGHTSRVWDCAASPSGALVASASGDGSIRVWDVADGSSRALLQGDGGDVYSVRWRPGHNQVTSASYDKILRSWDVETQRQIRTFSGHSMSTHTVAYDPSGNTIASGAKDKHIRFWDAVGGVCTHSITDCLGEITSLEFDDQGLYLLAGCRDNSNRLYDLRMASLHRRRNLFRYTGHQNTSKSFVRATFGLDSSLVISGSEDGMVYIWDREASSSTATPAETATSRPGTDDRSASSVASSPPIMSVTGPARGYHPPTINGRPGTLPPPSSKGVTTVRPSKVLEGHVGGTVYDVAWIAGGGLLSGGEDGTVAIWDAAES